ncbi:receptor-like serine/threonine-protein kinase At4g25390 [Hibiscus syriacus]|uniref:receptor-like serine/threonine-protein kinase At4g25390 n=1 Tax=Hibiscus syriacus TaxID=106335 RepID=UPI0019232D24|nr:receptor-like serine/threonine-protein kinase At4g25390 [Hibiscus syriacus]
METTMETTTTTTAIRLSPSRKRRRMLLVYELMPNGNMQDALLHRKCPELMNWKQRFSIAVDIAKGLDYLHGLDPPIMHGDIKPSSVLLKSEEIRVEIAEYYGSVAETDSVATGIDEFRLAIDQSPVSVTVTESLLNAEAVTVAASPESLSVSPEMMEKGSVSEGNLSVLESGGKGIKSSSGSDWWRKQDNVAALVESGKVKDNGLDPFYGVFR